MKILAFIAALLILNMIRLMLLDSKDPHQVWEPLPKVAIVQEPDQPGFAIGYDTAIKLIYIKFWIWEIDINL